MPFVKKSSVGKTVVKKSIRIPFASKISELVNKIYVRFDDCIFKINERLVMIFKKVPLISSLVVGVLSKFAFTDYEVSSLFILSLLLYFDILYVLFTLGKTKKVFFAGMFYGTGVYMSGFSWLLALQEFGFKTPNVERFLSIFGFIGASAYLSLYVAMSSYLSIKLAKNKLSLLFFFSCFITFFELTARFFVQLAPLISLAYGVASCKYFIQIGSVIGTFGITFLVCIIISCLSIYGYRRFGVYLYLICSAYGVYKIKLKNDYLIPREKFDIAVVQANFDDNERFYSCAASTDNFATLAKVDDIRNLDRKMLVIAPETIIWYSDSALDYFVKRGCGYYKNDMVLNKNRFTNIDKRKKSNIIVCTGFEYGVGRDTYNSYQFFTYDYKKNSILRLDYYNKKYLIPFGETLPSWVYWLVKLVPKKVKFIHDMIKEFDESKYTVGEVSNTIRLNGVSPFAIEICSDIINSGVSLDDSYEPTWILSTMNFHTFNGKNKKTNLSHMGLLFGKFRAIEFSRPVVMCINFGYSCIIDCNGTVLKRLDSKDAAAIHHEMPMKYDVSIFTMFRQKLIIFILIVVFFYVLFRMNKNDKKRKDS